MMNRRHSYGDWSSLNPHPLLAIFMLAGVNLLRVRPRGWKYEADRDSVSFTREAGWLRATAAEHPEGH